MHFIVHCSTALGARAPHWAQSVLWFPCCLFFYQRWLRSGLSLAPWNSLRLAFNCRTPPDGLLVARWLMVFVTLPVLVAPSSNQSLDNMQHEEDMVARSKKLGAHTEHMEIGQSVKKHRRPNGLSTPVHSWGANENENLCHCVGLHIEQVEGYPTRFNLVSAGCSTSLA